MRTNKLSLALSVLMVVAVVGKFGACRNSSQLNASSSSAVRTDGGPQIASAQSIRSVEFGNFAFAWLQELGDAKKSFTLAHGKLEPTRDHDGMVKGMGVTLRSVAYGDVTGDGREEAMVVLSFITGGSAIPHAVYVFASNDSKTNLLWAFSTGDRADGGLRRVYAENGEFVIERYSPDKSNGDCCPTLFTRTRFGWQGNMFAERLKEESLPNDQHRAVLLMDPYHPTNQGHGFDVLVSSNRQVANVVLQFVTLSCLQDRRIAAENGQLLVELFGVGTAIGKKLYGTEDVGACCPKHYTRTKYKWDGTQFQRDGPEEVFENPSGSSAPVTSPSSPAS